jgi:alkanesulfonate monooxygenase SsuD/methylene tetrahydromethanopterin reductase-like flavin-dependent oxidoreductase (luciferase family)
MVGALQPKTFELAGAISDGAITWLCPAAYLERVGVPRMERGAADAGRARPPLVAHVAACLHDDADAVQEAVRNGIPNIAFPSYQRMLVAAGFEEAVRGEWTDDLVDGVIAWGSPDVVAGRIAALFAAGADEVLVRPVGAGGAPDDVADQTIAAIAEFFATPG